MFNVWQVYQNKVKIESHLKKCRAKTKKTRFDVCKPLAFFLFVKTWKHEFLQVDYASRGGGGRAMLEAQVYNLGSNIWRKKNPSEAYFSLWGAATRIVSNGEIRRILSLLPTWKRFEPDRIGLQCGRQVWPLLRREHYVLVVASRRQMLKSCEFQTLWCGIFAEVGL